MSQVSIERASPLLGCGNNVPFLYDRRGEVRIAPLGPFESIRWSRNLDDVSDASVLLRPGDNTECCNILRTLEPWQMSVVIFRDDKRVWEGPIRDITYRSGTCLLDCVDVLGWTDRRIHRGRVQVEPGNSMTEMHAAIQAAFELDDPNVLPYRFNIGNFSNETVKQDIKPFTQYYGAAIRELARHGVNVTVVGRRIIVWGEQEELGRTAVLRTAEHILGDPEIVVSGSDLATRVIGVNDEGQYAEVSALDPGVDGPNSYYGWVERIVDVPQDTDLQTVSDLAAAEVLTRFPAPIQLRMPNESALSPTAPVTIDELVCGTVVPVLVSEKLCREVQGLFNLQEVAVVETAEAAETVSILLTPVTPEGKVLKPRPRWMQDWIRWVERRFERLENKRRNDGMP